MFFWFQTYFTTFHLAELFFFKNPGITDDAISKDQMEALVGKINKLNLLSDESHLQREEAALPSPIDKLFAVIDEFNALQREVETLRYEMKIYS